MTACPTCAQRLDSTGRIAHHPRCREARAEAGAATMHARRASVQADRRIAGALLRGAGGSRPMASARAGVAATDCRDRAEHRDLVGDYAGTADLRDQAARLDRAA